MGHLAQRKPARALRRPAAARGAGARADHPARVLLLDEPLSALDPFLRIQMRAELQALAEGARPDLHPRHALAGRGDGAGRPGGRDEPRPDRAGRLAARGLQRSRHRVRRALHGRPQRDRRRCRQGRGAHRPHARSTASADRRPPRGIALPAPCATSSTRAPTCCSASRERRRRPTWSPCAARRAVRCATARPRRARVSLQLGRGRRASPRRLKPHASTD